MNAPSLALPESASLVKVNEPAKLQDVNVQVLSDPVPIAAINADAAANVPVAPMLAPEVKLHPEKLTLDADGLQMNPPT